MLLLRGTLVVFSLITSINGLFSGYGPKPTTQTKADSKGWGFFGKIPSFGLGSFNIFSQAKGSATTKVSPTLPEATTQDFTLNSKGLTSPKYQPTATTIEELQSSTIQIGTLLPLKSEKLPTNYLLRNKPRLDGTKPPSKLDQSYDLDLWPPNNDQSTAKTPQTTSPQITKPELQTYTVSTDQSTSTTQTATLRKITETMNPYSDQTIPTDTLSTTPELTTASFQTTNFISQADPKPEVSTVPLTTDSTKLNTLGTTDKASDPEWMPFKPTSKALEGFTWVEQTTGPTEGERVQSIGPDSTPTLPAGGKATLTSLFAYNPSYHISKILTQLSKIMTEFNLS